MSDRPQPDLLAYLAGDLDASARARVEAELARSSSARAELATWRRLSAAVSTEAGLDPLPLPSIEPLIEAIGGPSHAPGAWRSGWAARPWTTIAAIVAVAALLALAGRGWPLQSTLEVGSSDGVRDGAGLEPGGEPVAIARKAEGSGIQPTLIARRIQPQREAPSALAPDDSGGNDGRPNASERATGRLPGRTDGSSRVADGSRSPGGALGAQDGPPAGADDSAPFSATGQEPTDRPPAENRNPESGGQEPPKRVEDAPKAPPEPTEPQPTPAPATQPPTSAPPSTPTAEPQPTDPSLGPKVVLRVLELSGAAVPEARVLGYAQGVDAPVHFAFNTDSGAWNATLDAGVWWIYADTPDGRLAARWLGDVSHPMQSVPVPLARGQSLDLTLHLDAMAAASTVGGIVRDETGEPMPNALIVAEPVGQAGAGARAALTFGPDAGDARGRYVLRLPAGRWRLGVARDRGSREPSWWRFGGDEGLIEVAPGDTRYDVDVEIGRRAPVGGASDAQRDGSDEGAGRDGGFVPAPPRILPPASPADDG